MCDFSPIDVKSSHGQTVESLIITGHLTQSLLHMPDLGTAVVAVVY